MLTEGASGGGGAEGSGERATVPVVPGQLVLVDVGGEGTLPANHSGAFNGGGATGNGGSGGGGSDIHLGGVQPGDSVVAGAGGGGDGAGSAPGKGGAAGATRGVDGKAGGPASGPPDS